MERLTGAMTGRQVRPYERAMTHRHPATSVAKAELTARRGLAVEWHAYNQCHGLREQQAFCTAGDRVLMRRPVLKDKGVDEYVSALVTESMVVGRRARRAVEPCARTGTGAGGSGIVKKSSWFFSLFFYTFFSGAPLNHSPAARQARKPPVAPLPSAPRLPQPYPPGPRRRLQPCRPLQRWAPRPSR